ncbi:MAG: glycosyl transferase group 1 [Pseudomonas sp. PGPPP4]|nr:MAG: glycosyl transferase group 1 [Pseudomonas sp. PGPPP4]
MTLPSCIAIDTRPSVLMVTHVLPYPPAAGNEIRIYKMLKWFSMRGYKITLILKPLDDLEVSNDCILGLYDLVEDLHIFDNRAVVPPSHRISISGDHLIDTDFEDPQLSKILDSFCPPWFVNEVASIISNIKPDVVIAQYVFMSRILMLPECTNALRIVDAHDLFCRKQATVEQYGIKNYGLSLTEEQERRLLLRANVILAIQKAEQLEIAKFLPERKILLVSFDLDIHVTNHAFARNGHVLIVASGNEFNVRGTQDFLDYTWPLVRQQHSAARLTVIGKVCREVQCDDPTVSLLGFVESLEAEYEKAAVVVNPCRVGTGLKIKTIEALAWGKAHVAWPSAADGLREIDDIPAIIAENAVDFADKIVSVLKSDQVRADLQVKAHDFIKKHFNAEYVYKALTNEIESYSKADGV